MEGLPPLKAEIKISLKRSWPPQEHAAFRGKKLASICETQLAFGTNLINKTAKGKSRLTTHHSHDMAAT